MPSFSITRRVHVDAPADAILPLVQDFREWVAWSPWEGLDPNLQRTYTGNERGAGSRYEWSGNKEAGAGAMTMTSATPDGVSIDLAFTKPFPANQKVRIDLTPTDSGTDVAWTMTGTQNAVTKLVFRLMKMENRLAGDFDRGLAQLKAEVEGR